MTVMKVTLGNNTFQIDFKPLFNQRLMQFHKALLPQAL